MPERPIDPPESEYRPEPDPDETYDWNRSMEISPIDVVPLQVEHNLPLGIRVKEALNRFKETDRAEPTIAYELLGECDERLAMLENAQVSLLAISDAIKDAMESIEKTVYGKSQA